MKFKVNKPQATKFQVPLKEWAYSAKITSATGYEEANEKFNNFPADLYPIIDLNLLLTSKAENRRGKEIPPNTFNVQTLVSLQSDFDDSYINQLVSAIYWESEVGEIDTKDLINKELEIDISLSWRFNKVTWFKSK